jgi:hypothetical protein
MPHMRVTPVAASLLLTLLSSTVLRAQPTFEGKHFKGTGDVEYLKLLNTSRRMFQPDPEFLNLSMLYEPKWNGLVEGPTWDAWWIQNSYGTTFAALPFLAEPFTTFIQNSQDLWFDQMGDGKRKGAQDWIAPDGCLCDAARPGWIYYRQGDGQIQMHDWAMEFTAAGVVMQAELLLISRDLDKIHHYLPLMERSLNFIESRRDPKNNLFLAGPAGNLLAPSYAGYKKPDGTYDKAYLTGLSITYVAALDRMIELEELAHHDDRAADYRERRQTAACAFAELTTPEGYFIRSLDPDGTKHGVYGAKKHGYLETSPNHDAIALRIVDDEQANKIYNKIASIKELRPHAFILPNYPGYDDMYQPPEGIWAFGTWVNGGHWSTCEARMILAYSRLNKFDDIRASMNHLIEDFAKKLRMDNPLTEQGNNVYQPNLPINITYDAFGPPAAMIRGVFEYLYTAQNLDLIPHLPDSITSFEQLDPIRFGNKRIWIRVLGTGPITSATLNDHKPCKRVTDKLVTLAHDEIPDDTFLTIIRGNADAPNWNHPPAPAALTYLQAHQQLAQEANRVAQNLKLPSLPEASRAAAEKLFRDTANHISAGIPAHH